MTLWEYQAVVTHTKVNFAADVEANYDKVTNEVWIWRGDSGPLKNRANGANSASSIYYEWAEGRTIDGVGTLTFFDSHYDLIQDMKNTALGVSRGRRHDKP